MEQNKDKITVHRTGSTLYPDMLREIRDAEEEINFEYYIVRWDNIGRKFFRELKKAAERGVKVRMILDGFGSWDFPKPAKKALRESGVELIHYNPVKLYKGVWKWILRDHRKILTIDGEKGYLGGMNIDRKHLKPVELPDIPRKNVIRDTHLKVEGPTAKKIRNTFIDSWNSMKKENDMEPEEVEENGMTTIVGGNIKTGDSIIKQYVNMIQSAEDSIKLTQSYFVPQKVVRKLLYEAVERGVKVQLITPAYYSEVRIARHATKKLYKELMDNGVEIYEYTDTFIHSKTAVVDDKYATVGSMNLDFQGVLTNREINLFTQDKGTVKVMEKEFEKDLKKSRRVTKEQIDSRSWAENLINRFLYTFRALY